MGDAIARAGSISRHGNPLLLGAALLLWLIPSLDYIAKFTGAIGLVLLSLLALAAILAFPMILGRLGPNVAKRGIIALCATAMALFVVLYPIANSGAFGPGSDRDDALDAVLQALLAGQHPYSVTTYLGNPPTPMPGALLLALPFYALGTSALQNLLWLPIFAWWCIRHLAEPAAAFFYLAIFIVGCPASLGDFVTGGDYLVNAIYVAIAMAAVLSAQHGDRSWHRYAAAALLSVAISSRPIYAIAPFVLAGSILQSQGLRRMVEFALVVVVVCAAVNGPLFLYDPSSFPTARLSEKLNSLPAFVHAHILLPALAVAIASSSFLIAMTPSRVFGLMAVALGAMLYPVFLYELVATSFGAAALWTATYSLPVTVFAGLWMSGTFGFDRSRQFF